MYPDETFGSLVEEPDTTFKYVGSMTCPMPVLRKFERLIWRSWFYFRAGYGTYIALLIGYASNLVVLYRLGVVNIDFLKSFIPSLTAFTILGIFVSVPAAILLGFYHMKRTGAYSADASLATEANPYMYKLVPGKEREVFFPLMVLTAKGLAKVMREQNALSPEDKEQFDKVLAKAETLVQGEMIGNPRQRSSQNQSSGQ